MTRRLLTRRALIGAGAGLVLPLTAASVAWGRSTSPGRRRLLRRKLTTEDGATLTLYRYQPLGGGSRGRAVLLVPELGMGREAFDLGGSGLAPWLQDKGFDVFVVEPRGHGARSGTPAWTLASLVTHDLVAAVDAVTAEHPGVVDLVLHGYSGALAIAATARELKNRVGRVVALSTPALVEVPNPFAEEVLVQGGRLSTLASDPEGAAIFDLLFARHGRIPRRRLRALRVDGFSALGRSASDDLLGWMRSGDLVLPGASFKERLASYDRPTLQLIALRNNWVHPEHATPLREFAPKAEVQLRVLSILHFLTEDYTHLSLLHGAAASRELFPLIAAFFQTGSSPLEVQEVSR